MVLFWDAPELPLFDRLPGRDLRMRRPSVVVHNHSLDSPGDSDSSESGSKKEKRRL